MRTVLTVCLISLSCVSYAQGIDTTTTELATPLSKYQQPGRTQGIDTTKAKPVTPFNKYQSPGGFGAMSTTSSPSPNASVPTFSNPSPGRVQSTYIYENGRVIGGSTTLKFNKKND